MLKSNLLLIGGSESNRKGSIWKIDTKGFPELKHAIYFHSEYLKDTLV